MRSSRNHLSFEILASAFSLCVALGFSAQAAEAKSNRTKHEPASHVAGLRFSAARGFFNSPIEVTITTATAGAQIYYTTNGSAASPASGLLWERPLRITTTTVLRAAPFKDGSALLIRRLTFFPKTF